MAKSKSADLTVIGSSAVIEGSIRVEGAIRLNGRFEGVLIVEGPAWIGASGSVAGDVVANELNVGGRLEGSVSVRDHLHVARDGRLHGDVRYGSLEVDRGGILAGTTIQGEDTISMDVDESGAIADPVPA